MRLRTLLAVLLVLPLLSACVDDRAAWSIDGSREHYLALVREQPYFWDKKIRLSLVVSRMPVCLRKHSMGTGSKTTPVEIYQVPSGAFIAKVGSRLFATESQTCVAWAEIEGEPEGGMGELRGTFRVVKGELVFRAVMPEPGANDSENAQTRPAGQ